MDFFPFEEIRDRQDELLEETEKAIEEEENLVAHAPTGLGKCVSGETAVLTSKGFRKVGDLDSGEELSINSFDENLKREVNTGRQVEKKKADTLEIRTDTGREVRVTPDHKVLRLKDGEVEWVRADDLDEDDFIASPQKTSLPEVEFRFTLADLSKDSYSDSVRIKFTGMAELMAHFKEEDRELEDKTGIPRKNFTRMRENKPVKLNHCLKLTDLASISKQELEITEIHYNNRNRIQMPDIDDDFCYFLGMMLGDGSIMGKRETIGFSTQDQEMEEIFRKQMAKFDSEVREVHGDKYGYKSSNRSLALLLKELGLPSGIKEEMKIPDCVLTSKNNLSNFISGLLDTDGGVDSQEKLELTTKSKQLSTQLLIAFSIFGIRPTRKEKTVDDKKYYRLFISNQKELEKLRDKIGFKIERKEEKLEEALEKDYNPNKNVIPEISEAIRDARRESEIPYSRKTLRRRLESYETGNRNPSKEGLKEIIEYYNWKKDDKNFQKIRKLIESDVYWDKIKKIESKESEKVYDLNEPKNHNFTGNNLILHNTAATVTPALEKAREEDKTVFFLTPRHSQHEIALETVRKMNERHGENIISVDLIGKDHLCEADISTRGGEGPDCPRHDNTFKDNHELTKQASRKLKEVKHQNLSAGKIKEACNKVCAYSISMQLAAEADLIIADYFHIFHPGVREAVLENADTDLENAILIVDEAHNMPSRTRSLYTYSLSMPNIKRSITEAETFGYYAEQENLEQLKRSISRIANEKLSQTSHDETIEKEALVDSIDNFHDYEEMVKDLETVAEEVEEEQERSYCAQIAEFLRAWKEGKENGYVRVIKRERTGGQQKLKIKYSCLDPQISSKKPLNKAHSSILMSATLTPPQMYVELLGLDEEETTAKTFNSPFPEENELDLVIPTLTTKYEERDESMMQKYAWCLSKSFEAVEGNCGVFFPSYAMMKKVKPLIENHTDRSIFVEERSADKDEKQDLLDSFADRKNDGDSVLLGVAAGSYGEGVDFPGEILKAVFIVGLPLKRPDLETQELIDFYDQKFGKGWDYGYSYPAMNRAIQAAGRCIRSETDEGVIVYMDERYEWSNYRKVFPEDKKLISTRAPWKEIDKFFEERS